MARRRIKVPYERLRILANGYNPWTENICLCATKRERISLMCLLLLWKYLRHGSGMTIQGLNYTVAVDILSIEEV